MEKYSKNSCLFIERHVSIFMKSIFTQNSKWIHICTIGWFSNCSSYISTKKDCFRIIAFFLRSSIRQWTIYQLLTLQQLSCGRLCERIVLGKDGSPLLIYYYYLSTVFLFLADLSCISTRMIWRMGWIAPGWNEGKDEFIIFFKWSWWKIASAARNWINSVPQTSATTFTFFSVFTLLLWLALSEFNEKKYN